MAKLSTRDISLLTLSALIMSASVCAITFGYEQVLHWFHLDAHYSRNKLAEVRQVDEASSRRKEFLTPEFRPLKERQAIFSNDSVMTGHESGLVIHFLDGSKVELAPDTMVQIKEHEEGSDSQKFHFEITVEKGKVKGTSPEQSIKVKQADTEKVEILKPEPTPIISNASSAATTEIEIDFSYLTKKPPDSNQKNIENSTTKQNQTLVEGPKILDEWRPELKLPTNDSILLATPHHEVLFTWSSHAEVHEFLFELATKSSMKEPIFSTKTKLNFTQATLSHAGTYYWRVTDLETGQRSRVGKFSEHLKPILGL